MNIEPSRADLSARPPRNPKQQLKRMCREFEAVFYRQVFQAMRKTETDGGLIKHSPGEEMFTSLLDDRLASEAAQRSRRGIAEALYRQLSQRLKGGN